MSLGSVKIRIKATAVHLAISGLVAGTAMAVIFLVWYPGALAGAQGVDRLILIMIGVDVVLGPIMTLIVYVPGKKGLWFDLMVIAAVQTAALLYGMGTIFGGRPAYVVFNVDRFDVVAVQEVDEASLEKAMAAGQPGISWFGPHWTAARMPSDPDKQFDITMNAMAGGADLPQLPELFVPLKRDREQMLRRLRPLDELRKINELDDAAWAKRLADWGGRPEAELGYLPMNANAREGAVILDADTAEIIDVVLLTPSFSPLKKETVPGVPSEKGGEGTGPGHSAHPVLS